MTTEEQLKIIEKMKYKESDKVKIKSLDWYNENKNNENCIDLIRDYGHGFNFIEPMSAFCGRVMTISDVSCDYYNMLEDSGEYYWTDEMIEGLVEEEDKETSYENMFPNTENDVRRRSTIQVLEYARSLDNYNQYGKADIDKNIAWLEKQGKSAPEARADNELVEEEVGLIDKLSGRWVNEFNLPDGYIFKDENGNIINSQKIILEKKPEVIPDLQLDSIRTQREYCTNYSRVWLEIYENDPSTCILTHLLVDEDHRQRGYGTKALEQAEIIAKDLGCDVVQLMVETDSWMHDWYLRRGYEFLEFDEDDAVCTWLCKKL